MEGATASAFVAPSGKSGSSMEPTRRILDIKSDILKSRNSICLERPALLKQFQKSPGGRAAESEHPLVKRAMTVAWLLSRRVPRIYPGELIIGNMTSKRVAGIYYPEGATVNILEDMFRLDRRANPISLSFREKLRLFRIGLTTVRTSVAGRVFLRLGRFSHFIDFFRANRYIISEEAGIGHQVCNYRRVVHEGLRGADEEAARRLESGAMPDGSPLSDDQAAFYKSVQIIITGIRQMASNLADEAEKQAREPGLAKARVEELLTSARACRRAPYEPARTFLEGLQACWLVHMALLTEDYEQGMSFGRLDQILYPLYREEIDGGFLSPEKAMEIMASFQLKTCETMPVYSVRMDRYFSGNGVAQGITIGGTDEEGKDVTNELSGLVLDAFSWLQTREPALHARVHEDSPAWFIDKAVDLVQTGCGKPSFFGDAAIVNALKGAGMTTAHARDYAIIGCVELASQGRTYNSSDAALFNLPICLEQALNEGRLFPRRLPAWKRVGAATPSPEKMTSFEDVVSAFRTQVFHALDEVAGLISWIEEVYPIHRPTAINSILTDGCMEKGLDVTWGGGQYDYTSIQAVGLADAGDSLFAIKRLVFDEKRLSLGALVDILKNNYRGQEPLRQELVNRFPHYGNGNAEADRMTRIAADAFSDAVRSHKNSRGGQYIPGIYSMTCHLGFGERTGALPNGRLAGRRLSNGLAPSDGAERRGPTAVLRSAASIDSSKWANCCALNIKFDRKTVRGKTGKNALAGLFRAYFQQGGMQVQANVMDADMLREARRDPSAFPGLMVRVAGYCAYFNDLQPEVQDEIIERTAHGVGVN